MKGMDSRRITIHLLKGVGGRRNNAEVDRVWEVTPGLFTQPVTYVLECKWGLVNKRHVDDFFEVLKWSKDFGADTPDGRSIKQGVNGIFAASSFNPNEKVHMKDGAEVSLASYAQRMNIQLLKASDFNKKLHDKGCPSEVSVQSICKVASKEDEVSEMLTEIWDDPSRSKDVLDRIRVKNIGIYEFEEKLQANIVKREEGFDEG